MITRSLPLRAKSATLARSTAPDYAKAREYLGEAWMVKGRPDLAKEQLKVIAGICGHSCEEYRDLQAAINGHPES
mgnify:CR=1 FL=1